MKRYLITLPALAVTGVALFATVLWWTAPRSGAQALARPAAKPVDAPTKTGPSERSSDSDAYLAGVWKEEMAGDIEAAMRAYNAKIAEFDATRAAAATSIFQLAEAYQRLGRRDEARIQYARLLREFVDYPDLAQRAQTKIKEAVIAPHNEEPPVMNEARAVIQGSGVTPEILASAPTVRKLFLEEMALLEHEVEAAEAKIKEHIEAPASVRPLKRELLRLQQQLAAADAIASRSGERKRAADLATSDEAAQPSGVTPEQIATDPTVRALVLEEMALLAKEVAGNDALITKGLASASSVLPLRRELLRLQQRLAAADAIQNRLRQKEAGR